MVGGQSEKVINSYRELSSSLFYTLLPLGTSVDMHDFFYKKAVHIVHIVLKWKKLSLSAA